MQSLRVTKPSGFSIRSSPGVGPISLLYLVRINYANSTWSPMMLHRDCMNCTCTASPGSPCHNPPRSGERRLVCLHHWRFSHGSRCFKQRVGVCSYAGGRLWMNEWIFYNSLRPHARSLISPPSLLQTRDITFNCACALTKHKPGTMDNVGGAGAAGVVDLKPWLILIIF